MTSFQTPRSIFSPPTEAGCNRFELPLVAREQFSDVRCFLIMAQTINLIYSRICQQMQNYLMSQKVAS